MKSNILINCLVLFYNVGIFPSDILTFFIFIDLHACSEFFATEPIQVFQNLILNGIKFHSEEAPKIHISAEKKEIEWVFSVQDNGIGIDPQYSEKIFEIFKRLHNRGKYPGTGIGLAICKIIIERAGGRIWVESELGQDSTFYFTLPINPAEF